MFLNQIKLLNGEKNQFFFFILLKSYSEPIKRTEEENSHLYLEEWPN